MRAASCRPSPPGSNPSWPTAWSTTCSIDVSVARGDEPGARRRPDAVRALIAGKRLAQRRDRLPTAFLASLARETDDLASRPDLQRECNRIVEGTADANVSIKALKGNPIKASVAQEVADRVRAGHRKRPRPAVHLVGVLVGDDRHDLLHALLGLIEPEIVLTPAPHDHRELAAGHECAPDVAHGASRQIEKHRAKTRKDIVIGTAQIVRLRVSDEKQCILE